MTIEIVYVFPLVCGDESLVKAWRFIESYAANPPGIEHGTTIVCNGVSASDQRLSLFKALLPNVKFFEHDNSGFDIGAFQHVARDYQGKVDMVVFFGASSFVQGNGWLKRMADTFTQNPNAQYGSMGNRGNYQVKVWPHIRTTGFWMMPKLLAEYPVVVARPDQRHPFEHGRQCFTQWLTQKKIKSYVVTWRGKYEWELWDSDPNGFHRGDQSSLLSGDRICERPYYPTV